MEDMKMAKHDAYLITAYDQANEYLRYIDEAMAIIDADEIRRYIRDAMPIGQMMLDNLEEALNITEDPDVADGIEEAIHHMGLSMDNGDQALDVPDDEVVDFLAEMRRYADTSVSYLNEAMAMAA
jgi:uncharacterized protein Yka (UPF0111/DUF47 family)